MLLDIVVAVSLDCKLAVVCAVIRMSFKLVYQGAHRNAAKKHGEGCKYHRAPCPCFHN